MALATLPPRPVTDEGRLWAAVEDITTNLVNQPTIPTDRPITDPNAELRAQLHADGATTILGIVPATIFDHLCQRFELFRFEHPQWLNSETLLVSSSYTTERWYDNRIARRRAKSLRRSGKKALARKMYQLLTLWPTRTDHFRGWQSGWDTTVTLALPLAAGFANSATLKDRGYTVGVAAVPEALTVDERDVRAVLYARHDPIAFVRCQRADGTAMVAVLEQNGEFASEKRVLRAVRNMINT